MHEENYELALDLMQQELNLPYVPQEALEVLESYVQECRSKIERPTKNIDIQNLIQGNHLQQEQAISMLKTMNLRLFVDEVQILLNSQDLVDEIKGELIEDLMSQKIDTPFKINKSGLDITFVPSSILTMEEDETIQRALSLFEDWFSNDNPTFYQFCSRLLEQEVLENRPFDFSEIDAESLAKSIVRLVSEAFGQSEEFAVFVQIHNLQDVVEQPLMIERRGENDEK